MNGRHRTALPVTRILILAAIILLSAGAVYTAVVFFYPFLLAFLFSVLFVPLINFFENRLRWNRSAATLFVIGSFVLILLTIITVLIAEIVRGLSYLTKVVPDYIQNLFSDFLPKLHNFTGYFQRFSGSSSDFLVNSPDGLTVNMLLNEAGVQLGDLTHTALLHLRDILAGFPHAVTMILFSLLASFFISKDWPKLALWFDKWLPERFTLFAGSFLYEWKGSLADYIKAQFKLVTLTAVTVFAGLFILRVEYAFTASLLIAVIDLLPYAGTGLVFLPWIVYSFINESWHMAAGLSVLYSIVVIQRQLAEPKILSSQMGIPPLLLLFTMFACYQFAGFAGVLAAPFILILFQSLFKAGITDEMMVFIKK